LDAIGPYTPTRPIRQNPGSFAEGEKIVKFDRVRNGTHFKKWTEFDGDVRSTPGIQHVDSAAHPGSTGYDTRDGDLTGPKAIEIHRTVREKDAVFNANGMFQGTAQDFTFEKDVNPWADFDGWNTAKAVGWTLLDVATFGIFDGLEKRKVEAWKDSGLSDTFVPMLVEGGLTIAREIGLGMATGGVSALRTATTIGLMAKTGFLTAVAMRGASEGMTHSIDAYNDFKQGNYLSGAINVFMAGASFLEARAGLGGLTKLSKLHFPKPKVEVQAGSRQLRLPQTNPLLAGSNTLGETLANGKVLLQPVYNSQFLGMV
jgi:hypothetical protein